MARFPFRRSVPEKRDGLGNPELPVFDYILGLTDGADGAIGRHVTPQRAMRVVAFLACVKLLSETIASLPVQLFEAGDSPGKRMISQDPRADLLSFSPNPDMTGYKFWAYLVVSMCVYGNAYVWMESDAKGDFVALWPIAPSKVRYHRDGDVIRWIVDMPSGRQGWLFDEEIMHFSGVALDTHVGLSNVQMARQALGISIAAEDYAGRMFENDGTPGAIFTSDKRMTDAQFDQFMAQYRASHEGLRNSHKFTLLPPGIDYKQPGFDPTNLQMVEARKFQVREVARLMRCPPHMIGDLDGSATFASVEQMSIDFIAYTIRPWLFNIQQVVRRGMFSSKADRARGFFIDHDVNALLVPDSLTRAKLDQSDRMFGVKTTNEVREGRGLPPIDGGDVLWMPVNLTPLDANGLPLYNRTGVVSDAVTPGSAAVPDASADPLADSGPAAT